MFECRYGDVVEACGFFDRFVYPLYWGLDQSALAAWVKASVWIVPWAGALHLLALGLLGGAILLVDMRVLGFGLTSLGPERMQRLARPLCLLALVLAIPSGLVLALGELLNIYDSPPYWLKMASLAAALVFTFGVRDRLIAAGGQLPRAGWWLAALSLALWAGAFLAYAEKIAWIAMGVLATALAAFAWLGQRRQRATGRFVCDARTKAASLISLALWLTTAAAGRWIAFY
jgi:hypothetical protein